MKGVKIKLDSTRNALGDRRGICCIWLYHLGFDLNIENILQVELWHFNYLNYCSTVGRIKCINLSKYCCCIISFMFKHSWSNIFNTYFWNPFYASDECQLGLPIILVCTRLRDLTESHISSTKTRIKRQQGWLITLIWGFLVLNITEDF